MSKTISNPMLEVSLPDSAVKSILWPDVNIIINNDVYKPTTIDISRLKAVGVMVLGTLNSDVHHAFKCKHDEVAVSLSAGELSRFLRVCPQGPGGELMQKYQIKVLVGCRSILEREGHIAPQDIVLPAKYHRSGSYRNDVGLGFMPGSNSCVPSARFGK